MTNSVSCTSLFAATLLCSAMAIAEQDGSADPTSWASYQIVATRNIFSWHRTAAAPVVPQEHDAQTPGFDGDIDSPLSSEQQTAARASYVLVGVAIEVERRIAFFEHPGTKQTIKSSIGEPLVGGSIIAIRIDGIEFEVNGQSITVTPGETLTGTAASGLTTDSLSDGVNRDATSNNAVLERMRQRRQEELNP